MCLRWKDSFRCFLADMGDPPEGFTIERINNDGHYEPGNCRWATRIENMSNRRCTRKVLFNGSYVTPSHVARAINESVSMVYNRLRRLGWPEVDIASIDLKRRKPYVATRQNI